jgi:hypothetical protein
MVELPSLLFVDHVDCRNELAIMAPPAVLVALYSLVAVLGLIHGFSLSLTLVLQEYCADGLLAEGVACCVVEQLPCRSQFAAPKLVNVHFIGRSRDERSYHIHIHNIGKLVALLGKVADTLT